MNLKEEKNNGKKFGKSKEYIFAFIPYILALKIHYILVSPMN